MPELAEDEYKTEQETELSIHLRWPIEADMPFQWANQYAISTSTGPEVILRFGTFSPVFLHREEDELREFAESAEIKTVAQIVLSKEGFKNYVKILTERAEKMGLLDEASD